MALSSKDAKQSTRLQSSTELCSVFFISFKSLLVFIYEIINVFIGKLSGKNRKSQSNGIKVGTPTRRLKDVSEIPGPTSLPFFGTLFTSPELKSWNLMKANEDREKKYGPMVKEEYFWNIPLIIVLGTEEIRKVIKLNSILRPGLEISNMYRQTRPDRYNTMGIVSAQGHDWIHLHNIFASVTTNIKFVRSLLEAYNDISSDAIALFAEQTSPTNAAPQIVNKLITESSFAAAFGKRFGFIGKDNTVSDRLKLFANCHDEYWKAFHTSMYEFPWWKYFPTKLWKDFGRCEDHMMEVVSQLIDETLEDGSAGGILGSVKIDKIQRQDLNTGILELILGATEPVYHTMLIVMYWIGKYDHVKERLFEELKEQLPTKDSPVDEVVLDNTPYLKACIFEALRICPTTSNVARVMEQEAQIGEYRLPQYSVVIAQHWHACLKDSNFYRAKEYLPERWLFVDGAPPFRPHDRQIMSNFGIGTRQCPGSKMALQLMTTFFTKLFRKYNVKFTKEIKLRYEWLLAVQEPYTVELSERDS